MLDDDTIARKISAHLGSQPEVPTRVAYQLSQARARALMRVGARPAPWGRRAPWLSLRASAGIVLVMLMVAYAVWQINGPTPDLASLDIELLTGELPPAAYLDPGFARVVSRIVR